MPTANSMLNDEKLNVFLLKLGTILGCLLSTFLFIIVLETVASAISKKRKEKKMHKYPKGKSKTDPL